MRRRGSLRTRSGWRRCAAVLGVVCVLGLLAASPAGLSSAPGEAVRGWLAESRVTARPSAGAASAAAPPVAASTAAGRIGTASVRALGFPQQGPGSYALAAGRTDVVGRSGRLLRLHVAVEHRITGISAAGFAAAAMAALGDRRSWTGQGAFRLQRVAPSDRADFTIFLVTPATRDRLCADGYDRYTSCRNGDKVVINVARWAHGVPRYGAPLAVYRKYLINHEVGHRLGRRHELCTRRGGPAPLMQQQSLGLHGCTANAWIYLNGREHTGPAGEYDDPIPRVR